MLHEIYGRFSDPKDVTRIICSHPQPTPGHSANIRGRVLRGLDRREEPCVGKVASPEVQTFQDVKASQGDLSIQVHGLANTSHLCALALLRIVATLSNSRYAAAAGAGPF